jgi:hypothetical protein
MSRRTTRRKCRCCSQMFLPDPRSADRQHYCSEPACRKASKAAAQRRWLSKDGNGDQFRGPNEVDRVRRWRQAHPGYWRKKGAPSQSTQSTDYQRINPDQSSCNVPRSLSRTLQDDCPTQDPLVIGLISMFTGSTLQDDIAATTRQLLLRGRNILGLAAPGKMQLPLEPRP